MQELLSISLLCFIVLSENEATGESLGSGLACSQPEYDSQYP